MASFSLHSLHQTRPLPQEELIDLLYGDDPKGANPTNALISVSDGEDNELAKRSLDRIMDNLEEQIRTNLRRGDALTRCSVSQLLVMLPHANYEDSCIVCRPIIGAFSRRYPHSPAKLRFTVQPLEPNL